MSNFRAIVAALQLFNGFPRLAYFQYIVRTLIGNQRHNGKPGIVARLLGRRKLYVQIKYNSLTKPTFRQHTVERIPDIWDCGRRTLCFVNPYPGNATNQRANKIQRQRNVPTVAALLDFTIGVLFGRRPPLNLGNP